MGDQLIHHARPINIKYFKPTGCYRAKLAYWDPHAISVSAVKDRHRRDLRPWFTVNINGKDIKAVLSTATEHSYLDRFTAHGPDTRIAWRQTARSGFLRRHRVYIAMSQNRIYFTPVSAAPVPSSAPLTLQTMNDVVKN